VDLTELDSNVAKALHANKLIVRILRELDSVILAVFRDRIREDVAKLQKEADKVLRPLQEAKRKAASELRKNETWLRRMQASTTDEAQRREAELFCKEKEPELKGTELMKAMMEYLDTRASYMTDLEDKIEQDKEAFEKAQAALAEYEESDGLARRLQKRQEELAKLDKLADRFADLAKAMDPTSNSVLPIAPVRPPTARPPTARPTLSKPVSRTPTDVGGLRPPPPSQSTTFGEYEEIDLEDPDVDHEDEGRSSINLASLPAPLDVEEGNGS
jgi:tetrahydromethanopterin S-methyltransferase subunit B